MDRKIGSGLYTYGVRVVDSMEKAASSRTLLQSVARRRNSAERVRAAMHIYNRGYTNETMQCQWSIRLRLCTQTNDEKHSRTRANAPLGRVLQNAYRRRKFIAVSYRARYYN